MIRLVNNAMDLLNNYVWLVITANSHFKVNVKTRALMDIIVNKEDAQSVTILVHYNVIRMDFQPSVNQV